MKKLVSLIILPLTMMVSCQTASAMGIMHREAVTTDPDTLEQRVTMVPTEQTQETLDNIDALGDTAGALGVPGGSILGEVATGVVGLIGLVSTEMRRRKYKRAAVSMAKGVDSGTTDGTIKQTILKQSLQDGTTATIHRLVQSSVPKPLKPR